MASTKTQRSPFTKLDGDFRLVMLTNSMGIREGRLFSPKLDLLLAGTTYLPILFESYAGELEPGEFCFTEFQLRSLSIYLESQQSIRKQTENAIWEHAQRCPEHTRIRNKSDVWKRIKVSHLVLERKITTPTEGYKLLVKRMKIKSLDKTLWDRPDTTTKFRLVLESRKPGVSTAAWTDGHARSVVFRDGRFVRIDLEG